MYEELAVVVALSSFIWDFRVCCDQSGATRLGWDWDPSTSTTSLTQFQIHILFCAHTLLLAHKTLSHFGFISPSSFAFSLFLLSFLSFLTFSPISYVPLTPQCTPHFIISFLNINFHIRIHSKSYFLLKNYRFFFHKLCMLRSGL